MKKTHKVVMLPTKKSNLVLNTIEKRLTTATFGYDKDNKYNSCYSPQYLYIISNEEIKEGDWFIEGNKVYQCTNELWAKNGASFLNKKIVATTDKLSTGIHFGFKLPQIPESFIKAYIKAYNEGKPITEVDLEMIELGGTVFKPNEPFVIKTRPDNTVIVHQSKMYTREEVVQLIEKYHQAWVDRPIYDNDEDPPIPSKWIQNNL